jgi:hypothetical protein
MAVRSHLAPARAYGSVAVAACRFVPGASTAAIVTQESWGVRSITRDSTGVYTIALLGKPKGVVAVAGFTEDDITTYHFVRVESQSDAASTVTISHKSVAFASVATGPAASDTVDSISVVFFERSE